MKNLLLLFITAIFIANHSVGQNYVIKYDSIIFDKNISDTIFDCTDSVFDDYENINIEVNAACESNNGMILDACDCNIEGDTVLIHIYFTVTRSIYTDLYITLYKNQFTSIDYELLPVLPDYLIAYPIKQELILQSNKYATGMLIKGFVDFEGKGKWTENQINALNTNWPVFNDAGINENLMTKEQIEKGYTLTVKGYFRCKLH